MQAFANGPSAESSAFMPAAPGLPWARQTAPAYAHSHVPASCAHHGYGPDSGCYPLQGGIAYGVPAGWSTVGAGYNGVTPILSAPAASSLQALGYSEAAVFSGAMTMYPQPDGPDQHLHEAPAPHRFTSALAHAVDPFSGADHHMAASGFHQVAAGRPQPLQFATHEPVDPKLALLQPCHSGDKASKTKTPAEPGSGPQQPEDGSFYTARSNTESIMPADEDILKPARREISLQGGFPSRKQQHPSDALSPRTPSRGSAEAGMHSAMDIHGRQRSSAGGEKADRSIAPEWVQDSGSGSLLISRQASVSQLSDVDSLDALEATATGASSDAVRSYIQHAQKYLVLGCLSTI